MDIDVNDHYVAAGAHMAKSITTIRDRDLAWSSPMFNIPAYVVASALRHAPTSNDRYVRALATITEWLMLKASAKQQRDRVLIWQSNMMQTINDTGATLSDDRFRDILRRMSKLS